MIMFLNKKDKLFEQALEKCQEFFYEKHPERLQEVLENSSDASVFAQKGQALEDLYVREFTEMVKAELGEIWSKDEEFFTEATKNFVKKLVQDYFDKLSKEMK